MNTITSFTGDTSFVEGNTWHDNVRGDLECSIPGLNSLGIILEAVRFAVT